MAKKITVAALRAAYRSVFSGPAADIVLEDLLKYGNIAQSSVVLGDFGHGTAENEGRRMMALRIISFLKLTPQDAVEIALTARTEDENDFAETH